MRAIDIGINADAGRLDGSMGTLRRDLESFADAGFGFVEIPAHGVGAIVNGSLERARLSEVKECLSGFEFGYSVHGPNPLDLMDDERPEWQIRAMSASLEFTAAIGAKALVYHAGRYLAEERFYIPGAQVPGPAGQAEMWARERDALRLLGEQAAKLGIKIGVENARPYLEQPGYCYAESLEELARMVMDVGHPAVGATLDTGHAWIASNTYGWDFAAGLAALAPHVVHIHFHDNFGWACTALDKKQPELVATGRGDLHLPPGRGSLPLAALSGILSSYRGVVTVEIRPRYGSRLKELRQQVELLLQAWDQPPAAGDTATA